ncbi:putative peptidoglycan glycosyltransferase FtsW [bioreactor metagenome]|uniref:peptidoglycan glycosyltransferase n=1 Tax=bioreactor metagenome TaxID=1076179 RepID=A0A644XKL0_9ZZZZ|nr:putative lipid II flippase FtsW [Clostridia bacterium]
MERRPLGRKRQRIGHIDYPIVLMVGLLCAFGLVMVFSASYYYAQNTASVGYDGYYFIRKQAMYLAIGFPLMLLISLIDFRKLEKFKVIAILISIILLVAVLIFGQETNGAKRWIVVGGQSIQPSEIAKFGMMLYMCSFMARKHAIMQNFSKGMLPMLLIIGVICGLVMLQPNMSMAVIMGLMGYALLFIGGCDTKQMLLLLVVLIGMFALLAVIEPYRMARLTSFVNPWADALGDGYQLIQSYYALGSGGLFGVGLNNSHQKLLYMTYGESDFIFAIVCEELGLIGGLLVIAAYGFIIYRGIRIALQCRDRFGSMLAGGITVVFGLQVFVNIGVCTGLLPTTGQALPFISAGGSSMMIFLAAMGVLLNISRFNNMQKPAKA